MSYSIEILRAADKFLDKLSTPHPSQAAAIEDTIEALRRQPRSSVSTRLRGYCRVWRTGIGNYRVCYQVRDRELLILVITISTRDIVYEVRWRHFGK